MSELNNTDPGNLSKFNSVFCDSTEALEWAYENRLPKSAIIKSSSPAMLWDCKPYVNNIESRWTIEKIKKFKDSLRNMTEEIFDTVLKVHGVEREVALIVSQAAYIFQKPLYKAACLDESDFTDPRLIIRVNGKCGPQGNNINPPWDKLLQTNPSLLIIDYTLTNDKWSLLSTQGVSLWRRLQVAGYETIAYRFAVKIMKYMPSWLFKNEILMHNENELLIEAASILPFLGNRDYLHSTTIVDAVIKSLAVNYPLTMKFEYPIMTCAISIAQDNTKDSGASIFIDNNIFGIYPIHNFNSECDSVKDIYKNLQPASYSSTTLMIENNKSFQMDFLKSAISLNKLLLNKQLDLLECSKPKGWFLGQLTIYTYPKKWKVLQLEFVRVVACKLFQTRVIIDGLEVAEILFVPKK